MILGIILLIVFVLGWNYLFPNFMPNLFSAIAKPFWNIRYGIEAGSLSSHDTLLNENEVLRAKVAQYESYYANIEAIVAENLQLKQILGIKEYQSVSTTTASTTETFTDERGNILSALRISTEKYSIAPVLIVPPHTGYDQYVIDGGGDRGFAVGESVYSVGKILIGKISSVLANTSIVTLYTSAGETYKVYIGSSSVPIDAIGLGGGQYSADVSRDIQVNIGDSVTSEGLDNIAFGTVKEIISDPAQPFQKILFAPNVNIYSQRWVLIRNNK
ncbi:MAG: rod shape-determining protein MreC [Patescibacteria group bacterium]|nr:rod shape-determining protein MreC [Patescibacteria group bacterium]